MGSRGLIPLGTSGSQWTTRRSGLSHLRTEGAGCLSIESYQARFSFWSGKVGRGVNSGTSNLLHRQAKHVLLVRDSPWIKKHICGIWNFPVYTETEGHVGGRYRQHVLCTDTFLDLEPPDHFPLLFGV